MSISSSAVLVELNISVWTAEILDKGETEKVTSDNNAGSKAAKVKKNLMAGTGDRKKIHDYAASCRNWHNERTIPWSKRGPSLLATSLFMDYKTEANYRRDTFGAMVDAFVVNYPAMVQVAQYNAEGLGRMFDVNDYPAPSAIRDFFNFKLTFSPVPESGDFRLDVPAKELEEVKQDYDNTFKSRLADAVREPWNRLHGMLTSISEKMTEPSESDKKKVYHASLVTNAQDLCGLLAHLNITKDPDLEKARKQLESTFQHVDIDTLRDSPEVREGLKNKVDAILKQYEW